MADEESSERLAELALLAVRQPVEKRIGPKPTVDNIEVETVPGMGQIDNK